MPRNNNQSRKGNALMSLTLTLMLSACASSPSATPKSDNGLQSAEFVKLVTSDPVNLPLVLDCRKDSVNLLPGHGSFALVRQHNYVSKFVHTKRYWVVPMKSDSQLKEGEEVFVSLRDCQVP